MRTLVGQFSRGLFAPLQGVALILGSPKRAFLSILPFLIGTGLLMSGLAWAFYNLGGLVHGFLGSFVDTQGLWFMVLSPIMGFLTWAGFLTLGFLLVYIAISILAGPFLSLLAENIVFSHSFGGSVQGASGLMLRMFFLSLVKALFFILIAGLSFVLWFFPPLNILGSFLVILTIAFDCMDFAFEVDCLSLRERADIFTRNIGVFCGLATAILATSLLPGIFFLALPAFVAGASKLYVEGIDKPLRS